jgi:beta-galactosidase
VDAATGLTLNGKRVLLKGGCIHHDDGLLGSATIDRAEERKIELLKQNGFNAIRTSHNPPSRQLLDACDRLGMLVIDEAFDIWERGKNPQDYHLYFKEWWKKDLDAMMLRDRNHPSVIFWSIGNEVNERADSSGLRITGQLVAEAHRVDPTRPVTAAICHFWDHPGYKWDTTARAYAQLDVGGYNYEMNEYEADHQKYPGRVMMGTESYPTLALENWDMVEKHPYVLGDFVWTAIDYLGEASIGHSTLDSKITHAFSLGWPWYNGWCGDIDITGNKKPQSWYRDVVWRVKPIAMAIHAPIPDGLVENVSGWGWPLESQSWSWPGMEGKQMTVRVFSRAPLVRLLLNGKVIGEQKIAAGSITAEFKIAYQPATLTAVNIENGKQTGTVAFKTTGTPARIILKADRSHIKSSRNDLSYVTVAVLDDKNQVVPWAKNLIKFSISGAGELAAVGSANPMVLASFHGSETKTFEGRCLAIVRPTGKQGKIFLKATASGLSPGQVVINVN